MKTFNITKAFSLGVLLSVLILAATGCNSHDKKVSKELQELSTQFNAQLPIELDEYTVLNSTSVDGITFQYDYTYKNLQELLDLHNIDLETFKKNNREYLLMQLRNNPAERNEMAKNNVTMRHMYKDEAGNEVMTVELKPADYKE